MPIFPSNEPEKEYTAVLWTEGSKFHYIESSSLLHILQFEKGFIVEQHQKHSESEVDTLVKKLELNPQQAFLEQN